MYSPRGRDAEGKPDDESKWNFPDMQQFVTELPTLRFSTEPEDDEEAPQDYQIELPSSFSQYSQIRMREFNVKLATLQRMANIVKTFVSYKNDPELLKVANDYRVSTGKSEIDMEYTVAVKGKEDEVEPGDIDPKANFRNAIIIGVRQDLILSSGLQTHGMQINHAEILFLMDHDVMIREGDRYNIDCQKLTALMNETRSQAENMARMAAVGDKALDILGGGMGNSAGLGRRAHSSTTGGL